MPDTDNNDTPRASDNHRTRGAALPLAVGALGLAGLGLWNGIPQRNNIEADLGDRAQQALAAQGFSDMKVSFEGSGRDGVLRGFQPSGKDVEQAIAAVQQVEGVRTVDYRVYTPDAVSAPTAPSAPQQAPSDSAAGSSATTAQLRLPAVAAATSGGKITLTGAVPSSAQAASLADAATLAFGEGNVTNKLAVDAGRSDAGLNQMGRLIQALGKDSAATATLRDGGLTLTGTVTSEATKNAVDDAAAQVTSDAGKVRNELSVSEPTDTSAAPADSPSSATSSSQPSPTTSGQGADREQEILTVQKKFDALPAINFLRAGRQLTPQGQSALQQAAKILAEHPSVKVRVEGFTDSDGDPQANEGLSLSRAAAARRYLVTQGVDVSRTGSKGMGASNPAAPNTTDANKAKNRRAELRAW